MTTNDAASIDSQRATLLDVLQALAEFGRKRAAQRGAERRADVVSGQRDDDRAGGQHDQARPAGVDHRGL